MDPEARQKFIRDCMAKLAVLEEEQSDHEDAIAEVKGAKERREHEQEIERLDTQIRGLYAAVESVMRAKKATEEEEEVEAEAAAEEWDYAETALFAREDYTHLLHEILDEDEELRKRWNMPRSERAAARMAPPREPPEAPEKPSPARPPAAPQKAPPAPPPAAPKVPAVSAPTDKAAAPAAFRVKPVPRPGAKTPEPSAPEVPTVSAPAAKAPAPQASAPTAKAPEPVSDREDSAPTLEVPVPALDPADSAPTLEAEVPASALGASESVLDPTASQSISESRLAAAIGSSGRLKRNATVVFGLIVVAFIAWIVWLAS